jgi:hypothetical protein
MNILTVLEMFLMTANALNHIKVTVMGMFPALLHFEYIAVLQ